MLGKPPGVYVGPTHSGRRDVVARLRQWRNQPQPPAKPKRKRKGRGK